MYINSFTLSISMNLDMYAAHILHSLSRCLLISEYCSILTMFSMSHRERVNKFNEKLGSLTELNDIPRVSAAGNG